MTRATVLLATLLGTLSVGAAADQTMGADTGTDAADTGQVQTFTELDSNSDGVLDEDEFGQASVSGEFSDLDSDGDGEVNRNEYYQYQRQQSGQSR